MHAAYWLHTLVVAGCYSGQQLSDDMMRNEVHVDIISNITITIPRRYGLMLLVLVAPLHAMQQLRLRGHPLTSK